MKGQPTLLFLIALLSLAGIGLVAGNNFFQAKFKDLNESKNINILGEGTQDINSLVKDTFQSVKEIAGQKTQDLQKGIMTDIEKEAASLTKSQVDSLKLQICRDWGVISPIPSKTP